MEQSIDEFNYAHYVYRITNNTNKKYYIGIHSTKITYEFKDEDELKNYLISDGYWGSGTDIIKAIKKEGLENFTKEVLKIFSTREEVLQEESRLVTLDVIRDPQSYNLSLGGYARSNVGTHIRVIDKESGKRLFIEKNLFNSNKNSFTVISSTLGKRWITNGVDNKLIDKEEDPPIGWDFGKTKNKSSKLNPSRSYLYKNKITGEEIRRLTSYEDWEKEFTEDCVYYPSPFFLKSGKFLSYEYLKNLYSDCPSWTRIKKKLKAPDWGITIARKFYESIGKIFNSDKILKRSGRIPSRGFVGKTYITNVSSGEYLVISIKDIEFYTKDGKWLPGKIRKDLLDNKQKLFDDYLYKDLSLRKLSKKYLTSDETIKAILNLNINNSKVYYLSKDNEKRHGLYNDDMINLLVKQGWEINK